MVANLLGTWRSLQEWLRTFRFFPLHKEKKKQRILTRPGYLGHEQVS